MKLTHEAKLFSSLKRAGDAFKYSCPQLLVTSFRYPLMKSHGGTSLQTFDVGLNFLVRRLRYNKKIINL